MDTAHYRLMARYNRWMNHSIYTAAKGLSDGQRRAQMGAYFGSLHNTLGHLLKTDRAWMGRFVGHDDNAWQAMDTENWEFNRLWSARKADDAKIVSWAESLNPNWLEQEFTFFSPTYQREFTHPWWVLVAQFFNHQTHHRGQAHALLTRMGVDPGVTDIPLLPDGY
ncbi:DinB family protein [Magnetofaba australis]|uniref:Putative DinB family protein n=1 Tax=Magnetofaba australis IT-1 TaxID=1434232 RepID=A0A1Y2KAI9_9PROT|nr:DinB family protein [Magnetofaba australis]OSM06825.1 putative DinB family protein [Magnetofaba australis IT-1]